MKIDVKNIIFSESAFTKGGQLILENVFCTIYSPNSFPFKHNVSVTMFMQNDVGGSCELAGRIVSPSEQTIFITEGEYTIDRPGVETSFNFCIENLQFPEAGTYKFIVSVDGADMLYADFSVLVLE